MIVGSSLDCLLSLYTSRNSEAGKVAESSITPTWYLKVRGQGSLIREVSQYRFDWYFYNGK